MTSPLEQIAWTVDRAVADAPGWLRRIPAMALASGRPYLDYVDHDGGAVLAEVAVPVLAVWGSADATVPVVASVQALQRSVAAPVTVRVIEGRGHGVPASDWVPAAAAWVATPPLAFIPSGAATENFAAAGTENSAAGTGAERTGDTAAAADAPALDPSDPPDEIFGAEPASHLGLSASPEPVWFTDPLLHLLIATALAVLGFSAPMRRRATSAGAPDVLG